MFLDAESFCILTCFTMFNEKEILNLICKMKTLQPFSVFSKKTGPEPAYDKIVSGYEVFSYKEPFHLKYRKGVLPEINIAYEKGRSFY